MSKVGCFSGEVEFANLRFEGSTVRAVVLPNGEGYRVDIDSGMELGYGLRVVRSSSVRLDVPQTDDAAKAAKLAAKITRREFLSAVAAVYKS